MSAQVKILYGHQYERCKITTITVNELNGLNLRKLECLVQGVVGTYYNGEQIRMQYRDDEGTFVTISNESDVKVAVLAATPVQNAGDLKVTRLCLRVDDVLTPVGKSRASCENEKVKGSANLAKQPSLKSSFEPEVMLIKDSKRKKLEFDANIETADQDEDDNDDIFNFSDNDQSEGISSVETPFQRYMKKSKSAIEDKKADLRKLEMDEREIQRKLLLVKSKPDNGNLCHNCHLRLGHSARSCEYGKCQSVFSCGEEKFHPGEINTRGMRLSIRKTKADITKLEKDLTLKEEASKQLSGMLSTRIENALMEENGRNYIEAGQKKWLNLRKDVCIIEKYCKEHFNGKIPPKHKVSDILHAAFQKSDKGGCDRKDLKRVRTRGNQATKGLLEKEGICFPKAKDVPSPIVPIDSEDNPEMLPKSTSSVLLTAPSNKDEETEQLNMVLTQSLLDSTCIPTQLCNTTQYHHSTFHPLTQPSFVVTGNQPMDIPTFPFYSIHLPNTFMQYPSINMPPALQQASTYEAIRRGETELSQTFPVNACETMPMVTNSNSTESRMQANTLQSTGLQNTTSFYVNDILSGQQRSGFKGNADKILEERDAATQLMNLAKLGAQNKI